MASPPLTIRNLTTTPVELKLLERFEHAQPQNKGFNITRTFTSLLSNITSTPSSTQLALKAESFSNQDTSIPIAPFETKTTDVLVNTKEVLRLTFDVEGQRYRVDTPTTSQRSIVLTPLSPNPRFEFTAVYHPKISYLALFSSAKLESWMGKLKDEIPLSALSIPGTHNSPTCYPALPSVRCQSVSIEEQLKNGVRFLDIRVQPSNASNPSDERLILVHSAFPISLTGAKYLRDLINDIFAFIDANPTETVIISLKREGVGKATDHQVSKILHDHYASDPARWFTENRIPTLGEVRNKIVIIRRLLIDDVMQQENNGDGWCIDGSSWPDNCEDGMCSSGEIRVQDFYEVTETENIGKKIRFSRNHLDRAGQCICIVDENGVAIAAAANPFFINFLSASNFWRTNCWPDRIAAKINPVIVEHLCTSHNEISGGKVGDGSTGIVVCDWVGHTGDWDLVRCIVGHNAKLETK
jgi:1-phosphatidylinositol phosphodiesterase